MALLFVSEGVGLRNVPRADEIAEARLGEDRRLRRGEG